MENLEKLKKNNSPEPHSLRSLITKIDFKIDEDYLVFIKDYNGAEGFLSKRNYIQLWNTEDLITLNPYYKHLSISDDYFFFGSDGSDLGYAFEKNTTDVISIDFLEIGIVEPIIIAHSFRSFIDVLTRS